MEMHQEYKDRVNFLTIYIKEAHPTDEWQMPINVTEGVCYKQPTTLKERSLIAKDFIERSRCSIPMALDNMKNEANDLYSAWPERIYVIDENGKIAYKGATGPFGFKPEEIQQWLKKKFGK